jgi:hypothetical protein
MAATPARSGVRTLIPARIDRLPWSRFHTRMVVALGAAWILDGLEITVASAVADTLTKPETLHMSSTAVGLLATIYLAGNTPLPGSCRTSFRPISTCANTDASGSTHTGPDWRPPVRPRTLW